jgi:LmbE family N-acetylglucosaminyl deacetylase
MARTLLAILAHPDDESFGPGGTLARYADEGVDVHIAIATDGAAGSVAEGYESSRERLAEVRAAELETAVSILGAALHTLGYRDSGYVNDPANDHPEAFINLDDEIVIGRMVNLIRSVQPDVVITHDETGGYFHPDHIRCCETATAAFHAAADPEQYPEQGPAHQPQRLYYTAFSNRWVKLFVLLLRLRGKDPTKMGRNEDIDFTQLGLSPDKLHARVNYTDYWEVKQEASAQHSSQGGGTGGSRLIPEWIQKRFLAQDTFVRAYPPVPDGYREDGLFAGLGDNAKE